jgi:beta-lactamase regulating signal transducer with metallopeptidase domain
MGLLWLLVIIISKYRKNTSPEAIGMLSFAALLAGFFAFITTFIFSFIAPQMYSVIHLWSNSSRFPEIIMSDAAVIYLLLFVIPFVQLLNGYNTVRQLRKTGLRRTPGDYKIFVLDMSSCLGIKKKVQLFLSEMAEAPLTIGFLKPIILLPVAAFTHLSPMQIKVILLHELAHIKKNDYLINFANQIIITVLYFNPFAKALLKIYDTEREKTADDYVLQFEYDRQMYASTLLQLAKEMVVSKQKFALHLTGKSQLYNRVQWIMGVKQRPIPSFKKIMVAIAMIALSLIFLPNAKKMLKTNSTFNEHISDAVFSNDFAKTETDKKFIADEIFFPKTEKVIPPNKTKNVTQTKKTEPEKLFLTEEKPVYVFVAQPETVTPTLTNEQEQNVQQAVAATKEIFAATNWQQVENSLAESVTTDQKNYLKEAYKTKVNTADWSRQENLLRSQYQFINWDSVHKNFDGIIAYIKLDSIRNYYNTILLKYTELKRNTDTLQSEMLDQKIIETKEILRLTDSIFKKKIIEL